jgi:hypothetical protein
VLFPEAVQANFDFSRYPLTAAARASLESFDFATDDPTVDCTPKGMPTIMEQPYPMEIVDRGDTIELLIEEYDRRLMQKGATQCKPLFDTSGKGAGEVSSLFLQPRHLQRPFLSFFLFCLPDAVNPAEEIDILFYREVIIQGKFLRHIPDMFLYLFRFRHDVVSADSAVAHGRKQKAAEHFNGG